MLNLLRKKNFRLFFLAEIISAFGVGISTVGANWYLIDKTNDSTLLGVMLSLNVLSGFLASPIIGGLSDKYNRKNIILYTYTLQIFLYILIFIGLTILGFTPYLIISFAIVNGIGWTTYMATSRSLVKQILKPIDYTDANSLLEVSLQTGMFIAGGFSGILYKWHGFNLIISATIIIFLISVIILSKMNVSNPIKFNNDKHNLMHEYILGWKFLRNNKIIFLFGIISIIPTIFTMIYNVSLPSYVYNTLNLTSIEFGFSDMLYGIGGLVAGLLSSIVIKKIAIPKMIILLYIILIINALLLGTLESYSILFIGSFLLGYVISSVRIYMNTAIMNSVSDYYIGRSFTIWTSISLLAQSIISPLLGHTINTFNANIGFFIIIIITFIIIISLIFINSKEKVYYTENSKNNV